jgi:hypothetical protein
VEAVISRRGGPWVLLQQQGLVIVVWADSWDPAGNLLNFWDDPPFFTLTAADIAFVKAQGREVFLSLGEKQTCVRAAAVAGTLQHRNPERVACAHPRQVAVVGAPSTAAPRPPSPLLWELPWLPPCASSASTA